MIYLVTGASASGKSEYAESVAQELYHRFENRMEIDCVGQGRRYGGLYYVAAMKPFGEEARRRILRHQRLRVGKGFETLECHTRLERLTVRGQGQDVFLIECISNLLANELYDEDGGLKRFREATADGHEPGEDNMREALRTAVAEPILSLARRARAVVVVTNDVFSDGRHFDGDEAETELYCRMLGVLNVMLAREADCVVEVVCGVPRMIRRPDSNLCRCAANLSDGMPCRVNALE